MDLIFNEEGVSTDELSNGDGTYRVYAAFRDPDGVRARIGYLQRIIAGKPVDGHEAYKNVIQELKSRMEQKFSSLDIAESIPKYAKW